MEIEVGMYVRTLFGIKKIDKIDNKKKTVWKYLYKINDDDEFFVISDNDIVKASFNIMDLIEVGDYVNGDKVILVNNSFTYASVNVETSGGAICEIIPKTDIKSIVTKEQFEHMEYRIGE